MKKSEKSPAKLDLGTVTGTWYFRFVYQMRDIVPVKLEAKSQAEALQEYREILKKHPELDQPHLVFVSADGSTKHQIDPK